MQQAPSTLPGAKRPGPWFEEDDDLNDRVPLYSPPTAPS